MRGIRSFSTVVVTILLASQLFVVTAPPVFAADPGVTKITSTLDGASNSLRSWTQDLAAVGKLADALPLVHTSAGSVLGFTDLVHQWFTNGANHLADATSYGDLNIDEMISLPDGRSGHLTSGLTSLGLDKQLDLTIDATRTLHDQPLNVAVPIGSGSNAPQSAFTSLGGVDLTVHGVLTFRLVWDHVSDTVYFVADGTTPSLHIDASAQFASIAAVKAAVGILGVSLANDSTLSLTSNFVGGISDPNNDGRIAFENPDHSAGELAQPGSLAGLVTFGFGVPAGSLHASLHLNAAPSSLAGFSLPQVDATIAVDWADVSTGSPTVTPTGIGSVGKFLNMTPRDLADDIGQLITTLTSIQNARWGTPSAPSGNLDLPFFKGSVADAMQLNEALKKFLVDNTVSAAVDQAKSGDPTFVSLQELLEKLDGATGLPGGADISISSVDYNDSASKLSFVLAIHKAPPSVATDMNAAAAASSGGAGSAYTDTTLTDTNQNWVPGEFANRHLVAGLSGATIVSNTVNTLTLQVPSGATSAWTPTVPAANSAYVVSGAQGDIGTVQLGNSLESAGKGVANANAVNATAKVKVSYDASITLVLDLQPPTMHDPPLAQTNPDGTTILLSSTPIAADRLLIRTGAASPLFTADFPIDADVDIFANAGFLQVELKGTAHVCQGAAPINCSGPPPVGQHMLQVGFHNLGDVNFGTIVHTLLTDPGSLLDFQTHIRGSGGIDASVPGTTDFFPGGTAHASFHWNDLTQTTGTDGPQFDISDLSELANFDFDPTNPKALFSIVLKTLQTLDKALGEGDPSGASIFNQKIPLVGRSLHDLMKSDESGVGPDVTYSANAVSDASRSAAKGNAFPASLVGRSIVAGTQVGIVAAVADNSLTMASNWTNQPSNGTAYVVRSELDDVISILENNPSDNLQALVRMLNERLAHDTPLVFEYRDDASVGSVPSLVMSLDWKRSFHTSAPVQFDFSLPAGPGGGDHSLAGVQGKGQVSLGASGEIKIGLVVPLTPGGGPPDPSALKILDDSSITVKLDASVDDASIATTIGPLSISLGNPTGTDKAKAKASYSIDLAQPGAAGTAESFASFFGASGVAATLNASSSDVDCGLPDHTTALSLCATLPLYISDDGGSTYTKLIDPGANAFNLRLPKIGSSLADNFDLTGAVIDTHARLELPDPALLASAIAAHIIDFKRLDGLDSFLTLIEQSMNAASFGGKLPLIGEDLQQGADFIGKLRTAIDGALSNLPADGHFSDMVGVRNWVNNELSTALTNAGLNPDLVQVDTVCQSALGEVGAPTVALHSGATAASTTYTYVVASYITVGPDKKQAKPSAATSFATGPAALNATDSLDISWTAVTGANGYKVFRFDGGTYKEIADVSVAHMTDDGTATLGAAPENPANDPVLHDCSYNDLDAVVINADISQGGFAADTLNCTGLPAGHECIDKSVPLNIGIPGLSLRADQAGAGPHVQIGYRLHLAFGISRSEGFFVDTTNVASQPELALGLNFTLPASITAQLAFININASNCDNTMTADCLTTGPDAAPAPGAIAPLFGGTFKIDLTSPHAGGHLHIDDLGSASLDDLFDVKLNAAVNIDWLLKAKVGDDAGFPGIQTEFRLKWAWTNTAPGDDSGPAPLTISFKRVQIDAGAAFGQIIGPIVREIKKVTGPLDPVIKTLYAPIPVLSDLSHLVGGDDVTLVSIAKAFSTLAGGPDLTFVDTIVQVIKVINQLPNGSNHVLIPIGDFDVAGGAALGTTVTPDNTQSLITSPTLDAGASSGTGILGGLDNNDGGGSKIMKGTGTPADAPTRKAGFEFPVFEHPASLFNLLLGGDITLVTFDSGPLTLGFDWRQEFGPVYAPPPVLITMHGSASVTLRIKAGFDTYGIRKAFEKVRNEGFDISIFGDAILQSLFFATVDNDGKPLPVVTFRGEIAAGAEVSAVIITVGLEGGVGLQISFLWNDPNNDGKFRISEFLQAALNNPICLFVVSGRVYVFLKLFVKIGFGPFSVSFDFTIVDVTLLDFSAQPDCKPPPPKLGGLSNDGKTLIIYAAALGHTAQRGHSSYESDNEEKDTVKITSLHDFSVTPPTFRGIGVEMLGIRREFLNTNIERVVVYGVGYAKPMSVTFLGDGKSTDTSKTGAAPPTASFEKDAIVFGGSGNDQIKTGIGNSWVDGGGGNDTIVTGDRTVLNVDKTDYIRSDAKAWVAGGAGDDGITVGNGNDSVAGDGSLGGGGLFSTGVKELGDVESGDPAVAGPTLSAPDWNSIPEPNASEGNGLPNGKDKVSVGLGLNKAFGNGGDDTLSVATDNALAKVKPNLASILTSQGDTLVGGTGNDNIAGGSAGDTIYTAGQSVTSIDGDGAPDPGTVNIVDTGTGNDTVYGGTGVDRVSGHSKPPASPPQTDDIRGGAGNDILIGGYGTDKIYGGPGDDYVLAEPSHVDIPASPGDDGFGPLLNISHDALPSGVLPQHKLLVGGLGRDHIVGGDGGSDVYGDQQSTPCVAGSPVASDPVNEAVNTLFDGNDRITGGAGVENVRAGGGDDNIDVGANNDLACGESGNDVIAGGAGDDQLWGGSGLDTIRGDTGNDMLYGNTGNDTIYGSDGTDQIEGNDGTDWVSGGNQADVIIGGTRASGRTDQGDFLFGDNGADTIIGDNGDLVSGKWIPLDVSGLSPSAGGADVIFAGADDDTCYGGLGNDIILAGSGNDHCEGNNGSDFILGESGDDELIGGGFQQALGVGYPDGVDTINGGNGADVITGDNAIVTTVPTTSSTDTVKGRDFVNGHTIQLLDLGYSPTVGTSDGDILAGGDGTDVIYGQGGDDTITGDANDDYTEGGPGVDTISGGDGNDDIVGGSSTVYSGALAGSVGQPDVGDIINGNAASDVIIGDNGKVLRDGTPPSPLTDRAGMTPKRAIVLYDLTGSGATTSAAGADVVNGDDGVDVILGQGGNDRLKGNAGDDYVEGDHGSDAIEGDTGNDDLVGGSSTIQSGAAAATIGQSDSSDAVWGGPGDDVITGDNALVLRVGARTSTTDRLGTAVAGTRMTSRNISLYDLNGVTPRTTPAATQFGADRLSGGSGVDVMYGQDGNDQMSGGPNDDYIEGNGGDDILRGDVRLDQVPTTVGEAPTTPLSTVWPGSASAFTDLEGEAPDGQDDMMGGSSLVGFRDGNDQLEGDGESDFQLGDNGTLKRDVTGADGSATERVFVQRYSNTVLPANAAVIRMHDPAVATAANSNNTTRFCTTAQGTCEPAGSFGNDVMFGDSGDDTSWGQDGYDTIRGGIGNDDLYGELGDDVLFGNDGNDVILGDRGGVVDELMNPNDIAKQFIDSTTNPPKETYTGLRQGTLDHRVDLLHDIDGDTFVGTSLSAPMPHAGLTEGGNDRIRGGNGQDNIHAGFGDDIANGDSGGDYLFGDDGADVLWGGKGCDQTIDTPASAPDCYPGGVFDPTARGTNDRFIDHMFGGVGGSSPTSLGKKGDVGADIMDWRPRGAYTPGTGCTANQFPDQIGNSVVDPCSWFEMTDTTNALDLAAHQHHQGTDWMYGGWDRDVMQGDVAQNGPNPGDRLLDWVGAYNIYTHCNSAYGGFNDVRQHSPDMQQFLLQVSFGDGAGQVSSDSVTVGTSAFRELAFVYPADNNAHGSGSAFPSTPGHFDVPSCAD